jgi:hypothetical protein
VRSMRLRPRLKYETGSNPRDRIKIRIGRKLFFSL